MVLLSQLEVSLLDVVLRCDFAHTQLVVEVLELADLGSTEISDLGLA